jgi:hypothetical protein
LDVKTLKIGIGGVRKKKGGWAAAFIAAWIMEADTAT